MEKIEKLQKLQREYQQQLQRLREEAANNPNIEEPAEEEENEMANCERILTEEGSQLSSGNNANTEGEEWEKQ